MTKDIADKKLDLLITQLDYIACRLDVIGKQVEIMEAQTSLSLGSLHKQCISLTNALLELQSDTDKQKLLTDLIPDEDERQRATKP
jgi:spore coat polysaccharide biosynthesis protein SpsF (cytidylyltransferase family)